MASEIKTKPVTTLRDHALKAVIWRNTSPKGEFYNIELSRTYKTKDGYQDTRSFNESDLLSLSHLTRRAYDRIRELRLAKTSPSELIAQP